MITQWALSLHNPAVCTSSLSCICLNIAPVFIFLPLLFPSALIFSRPQWSSCAPLSERSRRNALAQRLETSWIPECALCRKALSLRDGAAPGFHGRAHKQEETLRESRYFTALAHYKHPEPGKEAALDSQVNPQSRQRSSYHTELLLLRTARFCTYNGVFAFSFSAFSIQIFFLLWTVQKGYFWTVDFFYIYFPNV